MKDFDTRNAPAYSISEAARYLRLSPATLRSWFLGRAYPTSRGTGRFAAVLRLASRKPPAMSFSNLVEAHVLRALRTEHGVPLPAVRNALGYASDRLGVQQVLIHEDLRTARGELFLDRYGELLNLSASGQMAMRRVFAEHLKRVEWGALKLPIRLYPFVSSGTEARPIVIDPEISFGRPLVQAGYVATQVIVERIDAGESVRDIARDYEISVDAVEQAVLYERAA